MWPKQNLERDLRSLLSRIEAASQPTGGLVADVLEYACPRLKSAHQAQRSRAAPDRG